MPEPRDDEPGRARPQGPTVPPLVDWVSRHSGWLLFVTILLAALLEGVGIYYGKRRANERANTQASERATDAPADSGAREEVDLRRLERQP